MAITWLNSEISTTNCLITIYDTNLTLNKYTCNLIGNPYSVMIGLDYDDKKLYIKCLSKDEALLCNIASDKQYKITIRDSYGRISNVWIVKEIKRIIGVSNLEKPKKFKVNWDNKEKMISVDLLMEV